MTVTKVSQAGLSLTEAFSGVLQTNANFVDQVIFGPAVDGRAWNGLWNKASVFSSLMLATIEDEGSNTEINIWDLTQQSAGSPSTTVLATVDLASAATPTAIAACMGYLIVSSEDGVAIIDPHSGAWAERTTGWPKTLTASTVPALTNADVQDVAAGLADQPALDPRTGGPMPTFALNYGTGADETALIKDDGNVYQYVGTVGNKGTGFSNGFVLFAKKANGDGIFQSGQSISAITGDDWGGVEILRNNAFPYALGAANGFDVSAGFVAAADPDGLTFCRIRDNDETKSMTASANRTYNTGYMVGDIRGAWLANSKTVDRTLKANTLTENGTVTEGAVASSTELNGYSGWTTSNYMSRAHDTDLDFGTASFCCMAWVKTTSMSSDYDVICSNEDPSAGTARQFTLRWEADGALGFSIGDGAATKLADSAEAFDDGAWHFVVGVKVSTTDCLIYVDGVLSNAVGSGLSNTLTDSNAVFAIGRELPGSGRPNANGATTLVRVSTTVPTATQVRQIYEAEKGMFVASAECLLQSGSTDAVLDVNVDPLTSKVLVTQTDAITVFDGLVVDSKPTVNSGTSEKGKLWGDLRAEQNSANAYVTAPATDQRQINEMVRGLASELPKGVDLSKAKAWIYFENGATILASYNIKALNNHATGNLSVDFAVPFKSANYVASSMAANRGGTSGGSIVITTSDTKGQTASNFGFGWSYFNDTYANEDGFLAFFGELENE